MATVWSMLLPLLVWMKDHPAEVVMVVGAVASMVESKVSKWAWAGKLTRVLGALGCNVADLKQELLPKVPAMVNAVEKAVEAKADGK